MAEISPLFAVEAEQLLLTGFVDEAIELCNQGLELYDDYPAARAILAKAIKIKGDSQKAEEIITNSKNISYSKVLDVNLEEELPIDNNPNFDFKFDNFEDENRDRELDLAIEEQKSAEYQDSIDIKDSVELNFNIDNKFDKLNFINEQTIIKTSHYVNSPITNLLSIRKHDYQPVYKTKTIKKNLIISDTMASILLKQGSYSDALYIYEQLLERNPGNSEFYKNQINIIKKSN